MKKISYKLIERLDIQAQEAENQGLNKLADTLTDQLEAYAGVIGVRYSDKDHTHSLQELNECIEQSLWTMAIQASDYYGVAPDATAIQKLISEASKSFISEFEKVSSAPTIGPFEPKIPGEK